jgi:hypothetical protein
MIDTNWLRDALLPEDGPPDDIYWKVVPIWCRQSHDELAERLGGEYACGFAAGFEGGLIMSNLRPEWSRGLYLLLRKHYLSTHEPEDLLDWEQCADETTRAAPIRRLSPGPPLDRLQGFVPSAAPTGVEETL